MPTTPRGRGFWKVPFLIFGFLPGTALWGADNFYFATPPAGQCPPAGLYQAGTSKTFTVYARTGGSTDPTYQRVVTVGMFDTVNPNPPTQLADPGLVITGNMGPATGTGPVSFKNGGVTFTLTFETGSDSEQVYLNDPSGSPVTTSDSYPGTFAGAIGGAALTVQGFTTIYYLNTVSQTTQPAVYTSGSSNYDLLLSSPTTQGTQGSDTGVTILPAGGVTGASGIDTAANAFVATGITGGYAAGGTSILNNMYFKRASFTGPPIVYCQIIIDYNGTLTDFNNPSPSLDTVYSYSATISSNAYSTANFTGGPVAGYLPFQPFMTNGQVIVRLWSSIPSPTVQMRYLSSGGTGNLSYCTVPYSPSNIQPVRGTVSPTLFADGNPATMVYTIQNNYSSPISQVIYQFAPNNPVAGNPWNFTTLSGPAGCSPVLTSNPTVGGAPGTITVNFPTPLGVDQKAPITMVGIASDQDGSYPISLVGALNAISGLPAPTDASLATVNTLGPPDTPGAFSASPVSFLAPGVGGAVSLSWSASVSESPQGYVISRSPAGGNFINPITLPSGVVVANAVTLQPSSTVQYIDPTATNQQGYTYTIECYNPVTQSSPANVGPVTAFANPNAPGPVTAKTGGSTVQVSWAAPSSATGSYIVNGYQVWRDTQPSMATAVSLASLAGTAYNDTTGTPGTTYFYAVASVDSQYSSGTPNSAHISALSTPAVAGDPPGNPPTGLTVALTPPPTPALQVSWTAPNPANMLNGPATGYQVQILPDGTGGSFVTQPGTSYNDASVTIGHFYVFFVKAFDSTGVLSNAAGPVTGFVGPPPPTGLAGSPGAAAVTLTWNDLNLGPGEPITQYLVYRNGGFLSAAATVAGTATTFTDSTLLTGTNYTYQVAAVDGYGVTGPLCNPITSAAAPIPPASFTASVTNQTQVALIWPAPSPVEGNLQNYQIQQYVNGATGSVFTIPASNPTTYLDNSLTSANAGNTITYIILDNNNLGTSSYPSYPVRGSNAVVIPPNAPATPTASSSSTAITVSWGAVAGEGVTQYSVYRINPGPTTVLVGSTASTTLTDLGPLTQGVLYSYYVTAINPGGPSLPSGSLAWGLAPVPPTGLGVATPDTSNDLPVTWVAQAGVTGLNLYVNANSAVTTGAVTAHPTPATTVSFLDTGVFAGGVTGEAPDTTFYYWLQYLNAYGSSALAGPVSQLTYPAAVSLMPVILGPSEATILDFNPVGSGDVTNYVELRAVSGTGIFNQSTTLTAASAGSPITLALSFTPGEAYDYKIVAINATGTGPSANIQTIKYLPSDPVSLTAVSGVAGTPQVNLTWADPNVSNEAVTGFTLYRATNNLSVTAYSAVATIGSLTYAASDSTVTGAGAYYYLVEADNAAGQESPLLTANAVAVTAYVAPNAPTSPSATAGNNSVILAWFPPTATTYPISTLTVYRSTSAGVTGAPITTLSGASNGVTDLSVLNGITYYYFVQATDSQGHLSPMSSPQVSATPLSAPGAPVSVTALNGNQEVEVTWAPATAGTLPIGGYAIYRSTGGPYAPLTTLGPSATGFIDGAPPATALTNGSAYFYYVFAFDNSGVTMGLDASAAITVSGTPSASNVNPPSNLMALGANASVTLSWTDAFAGAGFPVTGYQVFRAQTAPATTAFSLLTTIASGTSPLADAAVTNGDTYAYYFVSYANGNPSASSATVFAVPAAPPTQPTGLVETDGNASVTLAWTPNAPVNNAPVTGYVLYRNAAAATTVLSAAVTDLSLSNGTSYIYQVQAVNSNGTTSALSAAVTAYPFTIGPVILTTNAGATAVTLSWNNPASSFPVTNNSVVRVPLGGGTPVTLTSATSPLVDTTATQGVPYVYTLVAQDNRGHLGASSAAVTDGPAVQPVAPSPFIATAGDQQILLDWQASATVAGGMPVSEYILTGTDGISVTLSANTTWFLDRGPGGTGLADPTTVTYTLITVDTAGAAQAVTVGIHASAPDISAPVTTAQGDLNPPTALAATATGPATIQLSWARPNDEGQIVTAYTLYRSGNFNGPWVSPVTITNPPLAPVTTYTDTAVSPSTTYYYLIRAIYQVVGTGPVESSSSNHASATTPGQPTPPPANGALWFDANLLKPLTGQILNIYFLSPGNGQAEIDVYNVSGNPIRALYAPASAGAKGTATWDGKDRNGNTVASGIYLLEIKGAGMHQVRKVAVVK